ncbi:MAG: hypothetical protein LCH84_07670 [Gemmatimonadetes bacterium]|nr:hypothetical protein [Gemmatimonadota bacterium]
MSKFRRALTLHGWYEHSVKVYEADRSRRVNDDIAVLEVAVRDLAGAERVENL